MKFNIRDVYLCFVNQKNKGMRGAVMGEQLPFERAADIYYQVANIRATVPPWPNSFCVQRNI